MVATARRRKAVPNTHDLFSFIGDLLEKVLSPGTLDVVCLRPRVEY